MDEILKTKVGKSVKGFNWIEKFAEKKKIEEIINNYSLNYFLAKAVVCRDIGLDSIKNFFDPKIKNIIPNPSSLLGIDNATKEIVSRIVNNKKIGFFGDFDVDGITSTAIFCLFFKELELQFDYYIPDRINEGYGPNTTAIEKLYNDSNCDLIVTLDCGITSSEVLNNAKKKGIDIIVVDHHKQSKELPDAVSIINPNQNNDNSKLYNLAAVGVTFMLLISVRRELLKINFFPKQKIPNLIEYLDLVALGTICDVVPQDIYNRSILTTGLKVFNQTKNKGIKSLINISGLEGKHIDEGHLGFFIGPRINAGGRLGDPNLGVELLLSDDEIRTSLLAEKLNDLNSKRKKIEKKIEIEAIDLVDEKDNIVCVHNMNWHPGVIGIVASRLVDRFLKPVIVISEDEQSCKGSCRSIGEFDIGEAVNLAYELGILKKGGGHKMAAGLTIKKERIDDFKTFLKSYKLDKFNKNKYYDFQIRLSSINKKLYQDLKKLGPFGSRNPKPTILIKDCFFKFAKMVGNNHVSCLLSDMYGNTIKAISFKANENKLGRHLLKNNGKKHDVLGNLDSNYWNGESKLQIQIVDIIF